MNFKVESFCYWTKLLLSESFYARGLMIVETKSDLVSFYFFLPFKNISYS